MHYPWDLRVVLFVFVDQFCSLIFAAKISYVFQHGSVLSSLSVASLCRLSCLSLSQRCCLYFCVSNVQCKVTKMEKPRSYARLISIYMYATFADESIADLTFEAFSYRSVIKSHLPKSDYTGLYMYVVTKHKTNSYYSPQYY